MTTLNDRLNSKRNEEVAKQFPLKTNRYIPISVLGQGTWGKVFLAEDTITGSNVALKVLDPNEVAKQQMLYRGLTPSEAIVKEAGFKASRNIVPREIGVDNNGQLFVIQPPYPSTLDAALGAFSRESRPTMEQYPGTERGIQWMRDVANGLAEIHELYGKVYADWKPDNVMIDEKDRLVLNDLGTSTFISIGSRGDKRDNMGHIQTRARELFIEGAHPDIRSDIYGCSALLFRIQTGQYPLEEFYEEAFKQTDNPLEAQRKIAELLEKTPDKKLQGKIDQSIAKLAPGQFHDFYRSGLSLDPEKRFQGPNSFNFNLERAISNYTSPEVPKGSLKKELRNWGIAGALILGTLVTLGSLKDRELDNIPERPNLSGPLYLTTKPGEAVYEFEAENLQDLPKVTDNVFADSREVGRIAREVSQDKTTAYILEQYHRTLLSGGMLRNYTNKVQESVWVAYNGVNDFHGGGMMGVPYREQRVVARNIEVAFHKAKTPEGKIDLEDVCAISLVGDTVVNMAKRAAKSQDFATYITAEYSDGKRVIEKQDELFLKQWIANIHDRPPTKL